MNPDKLLARAKNRFWSKVEIKTPEECWPWLGPVSHNGYGKFFADKRHLRSNRYAFELTNGPIPDGLVIRHSCDNPRCCNPTHLLAGTQKENIADCWARGRASERRGDNAPATKLTTEIVMELRRRAASGERQKDLAVIYGLCPEYICKVIHGLTWSHLPLIPFNSKRFRRLAREARPKHCPHWDQPASPKEF